MLYHENKAKKEGFRFIIGVDEAGRGPLAGPVVASAVILRQSRFRNKIDDSKKLSSLQRENAFHEILEKADVGLGIVSETVIDSINILQSTHRAMTIAVRRLIAGLPQSIVSRKDFIKKTCLLIDGNSFKSDLPYPFKTIVSGDAVSLSIACASIIAKVMRDRILSNYDMIFPQYGFKTHKGYPTPAHRRAIEQHGLSPIHRRSFRMMPHV